MLVAAAAHRAQGLLYYRLATNAGVVNSSLIQEAIVPAISALAYELGALTTPGADLPIECAPPAGGLAFSARLVARPQGGWLALLVMWGDGDTGGNENSIDISVNVSPRQLERGDFVDDVRRAFGQNGPLTEKTVGAPTRL